MRTAELWIQSSPDADATLFCRVFMIKREDAEVTFETEQRIPVTPDLHLFLRQKSAVDDIIHALAGFVVVPLMPPLLYSARLGKRMNTIDFKPLSVPPRL